MLTSPRLGDDVIPAALAPPAPLITRCAPGLWSPCSAVPRRFGSLLLRSHLRRLVVPSEAPHSQAASTPPALAGKSPLQDSPRHHPPPQASVPAHHPGERRRFVFFSASHCDYLRLSVLQHRRHTKTEHRPRSSIPRIRAPRSSSAKAVIATAFPSSRRTLWTSPHRRVIAGGVRRRGIRTAAA